MTAFEGETPARPRPAVLRSFLHTEAGGALGHARRLFSHQDALQLTELVSHAHELGLDARTLEADLVNGRFSSRAGQDVNSAGEAGVAGTPSFFIDEVRYRGPYDLESMASVLTRADGIVKNRTWVASESP